MRHAAVPGHSSRMGERLRGAGHHDEGGVRIAEEWEELKEIDKVSSDSDSSAPSLVAGREVFRSRQQKGDLLLWSGNGRV